MKLAEIKLCLYLPKNAINIQNNDTIAVCI